MDKKYTIDELLKIFKDKFCDSSPMLCEYGDCYACEVERFLKWVDDNV